MHADHPQCSAKNIGVRWDSATVEEIAKELERTYEDEKGINQIDGQKLPQTEAILSGLEILMEILFPGYSGKYTFHRQGLEFTVGSHLNNAFDILADQTERALAYQCTLECCQSCNCRREAEEKVTSVLRQLPQIRELFKLDVQAALDGDPAAKSSDEIIVAYPGMKAVAIHRIAHEFYLREVPLLPRVMSEHAHAVTGIDIHPGANIGQSFFIDHGTGVVIGETAQIGANVKIYQGVTLGALSFPKNESGSVIKGQKRHPNIEHNVTIYAEATILGDVTIGHDSLIGGNVWLTDSVEPYSKVLIAEPQLSIGKRKKAKKQEQSENSAQDKSSGNN